MGNFGRIQLIGNARSDKETAGDVRYLITRLDENGNPVRITSFEDQDALQEAMNFRDENGVDMYKTSAAYRESVREIINNSPQLMAEPTIARKSPIPTNEEFLEGLRRDAFIQKRNELVERAGGNDAVAKLELAEALMNPEFYESAHEMEAATEAPTPYADMLKGMKQRGEGPLRWTAPTENEGVAIDGEADASAGADSDGAIITISE